MHGPPREPRIAIIGSGFSGLCLGIQLQQGRASTPSRSSRRRTALGGTWRDNTYPGAACDVAVVRLLLLLRAEDATGRASGRRSRRSSTTWSTARASTACCRTSASAPRSPSARFDERARASGGCARAAGEDARGRGPGERRRPAEPARACPRSRASSAFAGVALPLGALEPRLRARRQATSRVIGNAASAIQFIPEIAPRGRAACSSSSAAPTGCCPQRPRLHASARSGASRAVPGSRGSTAGGSGSAFEMRWPVFRRQPLPEPAVPEARRASTCASRSPTRRCSRRWSPTTRSAASAS